jgi:hypothetical protein
MEVALGRLHISVFWLGRYTAPPMEKPPQQQDMDVERFYQRERSWQAVDDDREWRIIGSRMRDTGRF